jgi:hypothetical protein
VQDEPEALEILMKYRMMSAFGADYKPSTLEQEEFMQVTLLNICMDEEAKTVELKGRVHQAYSEMGVTPLH